MPFGIGIWELLILLLVLLLVFGPKRLPEMGRQLGKGMREFKDSVTGDSKDDEDVAVPPAEPAVLVPAVPAVPAEPAESAVPTAPAASESRERDTVS
jgi:sec-independent protein translocase protein TatA